MKAFAGYYSDNNGQFYTLKEKVSTGAWFCEVEWIYKRGVCKYRTRDILLAQRHCRTDETELNNKPTVGGIIPAERRF